MRLQRLRRSLGQKIVECLCPALSYQSRWGRTLVRGFVRAAVSTTYVQMGTPIALAVLYAFGRYVPIGAGHRIGPTDTDVIAGAFAAGVLGLTSFGTTVWPAVYVLVRTSNQRKNRRIRQAAQQIDVMTSIGTGVLQCGLTCMLATTVAGDLVFWVGRFVGGAPIDGRRALIALMWIAVVYCHCAAAASVWYWCMLLRRTALAYLVALITIPVCYALLFCLDSWIRIPALVVFFTLLVARYALWGRATTLCRRIAAIGNVGNVGKVI